jgi:pilus assembly protein Flp/PilA
MLDYLRAVLSAHLPKRDERGASAVEYGLLIAGIAALVVVVVFAFGDNITDIFTSTCDAVNGANEAGCASD